MPKTSISCRLHYGCYGNRAAPHPPRRAGCVTESQSTVETAWLATAAVSHFRGQTTSQDLGSTEGRKLEIEKSMVSTLTIGCLSESPNGFNCTGLRMSTRRLSVKNHNKEPQKQQSIIIGSDNREHIPQCNTDSTKSTDEGRYFTDSDKLTVNPNCAILKILSPITCDQISGDVSLNKSPQTTRNLGSQETDIKSRCSIEHYHGKVSPQSYTTELDREVDRHVTDKNAPTVKACSNNVALYKVAKRSSLFYQAKPQNCNAITKTIGLISDEVQVLKGGDCLTRKSEWSTQLAPYPVETFIIRTNPVSRNFCSMPNVTSSVLAYECTETKQGDHQRWSLEESNVQENMVKSAFATINLAPCQGANKTLNNSIKTISTKHILEEPFPLKLATADDTKSQTNILINHNNNSSSSRISSSRKSEMCEAVSIGHQNGLQLQRNGETFPETSEKSQELVSKQKSCQQWKERCRSTVQDRAPQLGAGLKDVTVTAGCTTVFEWKVDGLPQPCLLWKHNDEILAENELYKIFYDGHSAVLQLQETLAEDAGTYICAATNRAGTCETRAKLSVLGFPPTIEQSLETVTTLRGLPARLQCHITSDPLATVSWTFKGKEIRSDDHIEISRQGDLYHLHINHVIPEDDGCYQFTATNPLGNLMCTAYIIIKEKQDSIPEFPKIPKFIAGSIFSTSEPSDASGTLLPKYSSFSADLTSDHTPETNPTLAANTLSSRPQSLAGPSSVTDLPSISLANPNKGQPVHGVREVCGVESKGILVNRVEENVCRLRYGVSMEKLSQMGTFNSKDNISRIFTNATGKFTTASENFTSTSGIFTTVPENVTTDSENVTTDSENVTTASDNVTTASDKFTTGSENFTSTSGIFTTVPENVTTASENVTTVPENVTTASENVTTASENVTTASENVTTDSENVTTVSENVTTASENVTTDSENVTTDSGKFTTGSENFTSTSGIFTTVPENVTTVQENVTTVQENVTTVQENVTTVQESVTTDSENVTTDSGKFTTGSENFTSASGIFTTVPENVTTASENVTTDSENVTTDSGKFTTGSENFTSASGIFTTDSGKFTTGSENFTSASGIFTTDSEKFTAGSENFTSASGIFTTVPENVNTVPENVTTASENVTTASENITTDSGKFTTGSENFTSASGIFTTVQESVTTDSENVTTDSGKFTTGSENFTSTSGIFTTDSGKFTIGSENVTTDSGIFTTGSENFTSASGIFTTVPENVTTASGKLTTASENFTSASRNNNSDSEKFTTTSGNFTNASKMFTPASGKFTSNSGKFTTNTENFTSDMENFTSVSGNFTSISEKFTSASGKFTSTSGNFTTDSGKFTTGTSQPQVVFARQFHKEESYSFRSELTDKCPHSGSLLERFASSASKEKELVQGLRTAVDKKLKMTSYNNIDDEDQLQAMMEKVDNFEERKKIRARLREIREKKIKEWGEKRRENEDLVENALKDKVKRADEEKKRILQQFKDNANVTKDMEELRLKSSQAGLKDRQRMADEEKRRKLEAFDQLAGKDTSSSGSGGTGGGGGMKTSVTTTTEMSGDSPKEGTEKSGDSTEDDVNKNQNSSENSKTGEDDKENRDSPKEGAEKSGDSTEDDVNKNQNSSENSKTGEDDKENRDTKSVVAKDTAGGGVKESTETKTVTADGTTTTVTKTTKIISGNPTMTSTVISGVGGVGGGGGSGGSQTTTEVKTSPDGTKTTVIKKTQTVTKTVSGPGVGGMAANAPKAGLTAPTRPVTRSPSAIKQMLLEWTKAMTQEYADKVVITNFSSSWSNGIAFCALIHHFYPDSFDFYALDPKRRRHNFDLAFDTAEKYADIAPLLDTDDMVKMQKPDWKCVFTYVQSFYRKLQKHERNKAIPKDL